ncbi:MAG TPA: OB-fold nucleic acid binding domain-containing protein, partial [Enhygromyxa sp.]|nr:OB-fold nucleic acid binding domain-containing protein [Enhygromyxa sp.]
GLRWIKGFHEADARRLLAARAAGPEWRPEGSQEGGGVFVAGTATNHWGAWRDLDGFVRSTGLARRPLQLLAEAGALECFDRAPRPLGDTTSTRRDAAWAVRGAHARADDRLPMRADASAEQPAFARLDHGEAMAWDYRTSLHSTRGHPLELLRDQLERQGIADAETLGSIPDGRRVRYVGLVICRQQPGTASGVTFCTLEDETGFVNLVLWRQVFEQHAILARTAAILGVDGRVQRSEGVTHLIADALWEPDVDLAIEGTRSRDFH